MLCHLSTRVFFRFNARILQDGLAIKFVYLEGLGIRN